MLKGQLDKAIKDYQQVVALEPKEIRYRQKLAELLVRDSRKEEAIAQYEDIGKHYAENSHFLKAIAVYKQIQRISPENLDITLKIASLNHKQGLIGNAFAEYGQVVAEYEKLGALREAVKVLEQMLVLDGEHPATRMKHAELLFATGDKQGSQGAFTSLLASLKTRGDKAAVQQISQRMAELFPGAALEEPPDRSAGQLPAAKLDEGLAVPPAFGEPNGTEGIPGIVSEPDPFANQGPAIEMAVTFGGESEAPSAFFEPPAPPAEPPAVAEGVPAIAAFPWEEEIELDLDDESAVSSAPMAEAPADLPLSLDFGEEATPEAAASEPSTVMELSLPDFSSDSPFGEVDLPEELPAPQEPASAFGEELPSAFGEPAAGGQEAPSLFEPFTPETPAAEAELPELSLDDSLGGAELELDLELPGEGEAFGDAGWPQEESSEAEAAAEQAAAMEVAEEVELSPFGELELGELESVELPVPASSLDAAESLEPLEAVESLEAAQSLESLESVQSPESLEAVESLEGAGPLEPVETEAAEEPVVRDWSGIYPQAAGGVPLDLGDLESHYDLGVGYKEMGMYNQAIKEFEVAAANPQRRLDCLTLQAVCRREKGEFDQAQDLLERGLSLTVLNRAERITLCYELAFLLETTGEIDRAVELYREVQSTNPTFHDVALRLFALTGEELLDVIDLDLEEA